MASPAAARRWAVELREERSRKAGNGVSDHPAQHVQAQPDALWVSAEKGRECSKARRGAREAVTFTDKIGVRLMHKVHMIRTQGCFLCEWKLRPRFLRAFV